MYQICTKYKTYDYNTIKNRFYNFVMCMKLKLIRKFALRDKLKTHVKSYKFKSSQHMTM